MKKIEDVPMKWSDGHVILLSNALATATGALILAPAITITHFTLATPVKANLCRKTEDSVCKWK
jgi:hypothetical protein